MARLNLDVPPAQYCGTEEQATKLINRLLRKIEQEPDDFIGLDTESHAKKIPVKPKANGTPSKNDPLDWMRDSVTFWSIAAKFEQDERWTIPQSLLYRFIPVIENPNALMCGWNFKYDAHVLYNSGVYLPACRMVDGLAMANLVDENLQGRLGLKDVCGKDNPFFHPSATFDVDRGLTWQDLIDNGLLSEWQAIPMTAFKDLFPKVDPNGKKIVEYEYSLIELFKYFPERVIDYASLDAHCARLMCEHLRDILSAIEMPTDPVSSMWEYFLNLEMPITRILWGMERLGLPIDVEYLESLRGPMSSELLSIEKEIFGICGWPVNLNSTPQLQQLFFGDPNDKSKPGFGLAAKVMTSGGSSGEPQPSTKAEVLDEFASGEVMFNHDGFEQYASDLIVEAQAAETERERQSLLRLAVQTEALLDDEDKISTLLERAVLVAKKIKRHRKVKTIKSTFVDSAVFLARHHIDLALHPEFKQFGARTGRFSTKGPNSQNIPRPDSDEFGVRYAFIARPGRILIVRDFGQLEMRIMAHFSRDPGMIQAINNGMDLHCYAVEKMYGIAYDEVKAAKKRADVVKYEELTDFERVCLLKRQTCKNTGFAIIYGAGAPRISSMLEIPVEEAQEIIELYFEAFPGVKQYMIDTVAFCKEHLYVMTLLGRRRRLRDINSHVFMKRSHAEREATNAPIQGSAADIVKMAMVNIMRDEECQNLGIRLLNQVHDELVCEAPKETAEKANERVKHLMEYALNGQQPLCVATPTDGKIVERWALAK